MQEGVFKRDDAGRLYLVKEAKPAWLAVLQGLKGTAKAQNALRSRMMQFDQAAPSVLRVNPSKGSPNADWLHNFRTYLRGTGGLGSITRNAKGELVSSSVGRLRGGLWDSYMGRMYNNRVTGHEAALTGGFARPSQTRTFIPRKGEDYAPSFDPFRNVIAYNPNFNLLKHYRETSHPLPRFLSSRAYNRSVLTHEKTHADQSVNKLLTAPNVRQAPGGPVHFRPDDVAHSAREGEVALQTAMRRDGLSLPSTLDSRLAMNPKGERMNSFWRAFEDLLEGPRYIAPRGYSNPLRERGIVDGFTDAIAAGQRNLAGFRLRRIDGNMHHVAGDAVGGNAVNNMLKRYFSVPLRNNAYNNGRAGINQMKYFYQFPFLPRRVLP